MVNPRGQQRDKPFRDAIRMEAALAERGEATPAPPGSLRFTVGDVGQAPKPLAVRRRRRA
jgi:hypothetical protein